jgi:protocatechuate 3,4-dioxygenase beta subunit
VSSRDPSLTETSDSTSESRIQEDETVAKDPDRIVYLPNRREVLLKGIAGAVALMGTFSRSGIVFAASPGVAHGETPGLEEGPFWVDGMPERVDVRSDSTTGVYQAGMPLYLALTVSQLSDTAPYTIKPLAGARIDIWNCNADGLYSAEESQGTTDDDFLRGYQVTNAHGIAEFLTNYPGWYSGRTLHVHFRLRTYDTSGDVTYDLATQVFFDETVTKQVYALAPYSARAAARDTLNATDRVFTGGSYNGSPDSDAGDYTLLKLANDGSHVMASFHIVVDLSDTANEDPTGGTEGGTPGGGGTPPGGGGTPPGGGGTPPGGGGTPPGGGGTPPGGGGTPPGGP